MKNKSLRTFYIILLTQTFSMIGSRMTGLAVGIDVYTDTGNVTPLALVAFFSALTAVLSAGISGVLADRWDKRKVMAIADLGQAMATLALLILFATGRFEVWHLYVISVVESIFGVFQGPAFQSAVTMLIPDNHRDRANAIQQITGPAAGVIAAVLAGFLFALIGATGVMVIDLFTFAVAMVVILLVHIPRPVQSAAGKAMDQESVWRQSFAGMRYLWSKRMLFWLVVCATIANFLLNGALIFNTPYILTLTDSEATLGVLLGIMGVGPLLGGIIMSVWGGTRPRIHTILPGIALEGVFLALYGITRSPVTMGVSLFFLLFPIPFVNTAYMSLMQLKIPPDVQGRVFSAVVQLAMALNPVTYLIAGPLADKVFEPAVGTASWWHVVEPLVGSREGSGMGLLMVIYGVVMIAAMLGAYSLPKMRSLEADLPDYAATAVAEAVEEADEQGSMGEPAPETTSEPVPA